ncbi:MAG: A/G-specific adenine glycosylase, partial [Euryarchaeota archaeon]|nr:A/G-specific adenine glycosylase [Euryarchaeota archaeon]
RGRDLPWRKTNDPYKILVSEVMLQQTQVERVLRKYEQFLQCFPTFEGLAKAPLQAVLDVWRGLGYNRRAIAVKKVADIVVNEFDGKLPSDDQVLQNLPGIGKTTAGAIRAFAFNEPAVFIETNIRTVFLHTFFAGKLGTRDNEICPLIEQTLDRSNPREWFYALMDYGVMLKKKYGNPSRMSAHHKKQASFQGSNRQLRGAILALIVEHPGITETELVQILRRNPDTIQTNLTKLEQEGFFKRKGDAFFVE